MIRLYLLMTVSLVFCLLTSTPIYAQSSLEIINYQGQLTEDDTLVQGTRTITFGLYQSMIASAPVWNEPRSVNVTQGIFSVQLQVPGDIIQANDDLYLRIQVGNLDERIRLASVPYAMRAARADDVKEGSINSSDIAVGAVTSTQIADGSISSSDIENGAVLDSKIADGQVVKSLNNLRDDIQVTGEGGVLVRTGIDSIIISSKLMDGGVGQINGMDGIEVNNPNGPVATIGLQNNSIGADKIQPDIVSSIAGVSHDGRNIDLIGGDNIMINADDANNTITISATGGTGSGVQSITGGNAIAVSNANGPEVTVAVRTNDLDDAEVRDNSLTDLSLAPASVGTSELQNNAVSATKIASNAVTTTKIANNAVNSSKIANNAVTSSKIANNSVTANHIQNNQITAGKIRDEPGISHSTSGLVALNKSSTMQDIVKTTISIPTAGFILVIATGQLKLFNTFDRNTVWVQIDEDEGGGDLANERMLAGFDAPPGNGGAEPFNQVWWPLSVQRLYSKSAGTYTFRLEAMDGGDQNGEKHFFNSTISAMFFPTAY